VLFATTGVFETAKLAAVFDFDDVEEAFTEDFTGVTTAAPLDLAAAGLPLATAGADWRIPRASFDAAVALLLTPFMVARVF
jgi:hypothetical protein